MAPRAARSHGEQQRATAREAAVRWTATSCAAQGLSVKITDPQVLAQVAQLLPPVPRRARRE